MIFFARTCIRLLLGIVDFFVPINKKIWLFYITPKTSWDANMQCVYALAWKKRGIRCVIVHYHPDSIPSLPNTPCFSFFTWLGLYHCMRAGVIYFDHALPPGITHYRRQCVNLWHGVPVKRIRFFCKENFSYGYLSWQSRNTTLLISSSDVDRLAMSACFQIDPGRVCVTGLPRNDILLGKEPFLESLPWLVDEYRQIIDIKKGRKLILYAPTYREQEEVEKRVSGILGDDDKLLHAVLQKHNTLLGIRSHIFSSKKVFSSLYENGLAVDLSVRVFSNTNLLLNNVDILITDYSSIWVDYLLLDRSIIGFCPDLDNYIGQRGFLYDFLEIFPGTITRSIHELATEIDSLLGRPINEVPERQVAVRQFFHKHNDAHSTERVLKIVCQRDNACQ